MVNIKENNNDYQYSLIQKLLKFWMLETMTNLSMR